MTRFARLSVTVALASTAAAAPGFSFRLLHRAIEVRAGEPGAKLRVLHLGDSHVAAEPLAASLRSLLAEIAGGDGGPGLFFPGLPSNGTRGRGVSLRLSGGWAKSFGSAPVPTGDTGLCGGFVEARRPGETLRADGPFSALRILMLRQPGGGAVWIRVDGRTAGRVDLRGGFPDLSVFRWTGSPASRVELETADGGPVRLLGLALENGASGLVYSPAGVVGAQANVLLRCREELFVKQLEAEQPDLLVLGFGTNEAREFAFDPVSYSATLETVIRRVRRAVPAAAVFLAGPPDQERSAGANGPRPVAALVQVTAVQREVARRTGALFLDLRQAMGGPGTARRWALASPALAQPDHVHFTASGYERLARLIAGHVAATLETERLAVASSTPPSRLAEAASRPFDLPAPAVGQPVASRLSARAPGSGRTLDAAGSLRAFRDSSGRLVVTNLEPVPGRTPELGRKGNVRR